MEKTLNIGIDCRMARESGIGRYISNLVKNLSEMDLVNSYTLYVYEDDYFRDLNLPKNFKLVTAPFRWHSFAEQFAFNTLLKSGNHDLVHFPQTNMPIFYNKKFIVTIHDLTMVKLATGRASTLFYPFYFIKLQFFKFILRKALFNSVKIVTVSEFVKKEIINNYQINSDKIQVIYNGIDTKLVRNPQNISYFEKNYNINKPFIFYIGNAYPHKNLERLVLAFTAFNREDKYNLVLAGKPDFFYERLKNTFNHLENLKFVGGISDEELSKFYSSCEFFIYPSLSEGFGIQIVEALGLGAKVCCSNNTVFPEIAQNNAIYFNPQDIEDIISSLNRTISSTNRITKEEMERLNEKFNWNISARMHLNIYEKS
jgi:glycosyltransferase involved in cell wall biosynthesis